MKSAAKVGDRADEVCVREFLEFREFMEVVDGGLFPGDYVVSGQKIQHTPTSIVGIITRGTLKYSSLKGFST